MLPERFNFARDTFDVHARHPSRLAMLWVDDTGLQKRLTFGQLSQRSRRLAGGLSRLGLQRGQTLTLLLPRRVEWWETMLAGLRVGAVISPGTVQLTADDIAHRLRASETTAVVADESTAPAVEEAAKKVRHPLAVRLIVGAARPGWMSYESALADELVAADTRSDDPALLYFTSGTTGAPKMALHTQASYGIGHGVTARHWLGLRDSDLHWNLSDTGWAKAAWSSFFGPWIAGSAIFVHHAARFEPRRTLDLLAEHPITTLCGTPTHYRMLIREDMGLRKPRALRSCTAAGEPLNPAVIMAWEKGVGLKIRDGYGQTETVLLVGNAPGAELRPGSMGTCMPGARVAVLGEDGSELPPGEEGELAVALVPERPVGLFSGYWKDAERNAQVFRNGWYCTGDRATRDADGHFWFVGRADDVIKSGGYRIGPFEVESALLEHPAVAESAVVGVPDKLRGQVVKAFVVLAKGRKAGPTLVKALQDFVQQRTAPYKYPREIEFVEQLPKTVSGKIRRAALRRS